MQLLNIIHSNQKGEPPFGTAKKEAKNKVEQGISIIVFIGFSHRNRGSHGFGGRQRPGHACFRSCKFNVTECHKDL
jgi:hypothetical protein